MANEVITTSSPYCSPERLLDYCDWKIVADALRDDDDAPRPLRATILDDETTCGALLYRLCMEASGFLESECVARDLYSVPDLQSLTGATASHLQKVVGGLVIWDLFSRRAPTAAKIDEIPAVRVAMDAIEKLGAGKRIFGLTNQADAGAGVTPITRQDVINAGNRVTVTEANRYFGSRAGRTWRGGCCG